jgi:hypothetical protein
MVRFGRGPGRRRRSIRLTDEVGALVSGMPLRESGEPEDWDNLCFMAACFVCRQIDHMTAVLTLVDKGLDSEALVLGRSMLEGMIQLLWAAQEPEERPLRWRAFSLIEDWRLAQQDDRTSITVEKDQWRALDARVRSEGVPFLTQRAKNAIASGNPPPPDPYHANWFGGRKTRDLFEQTSGAELWSLYGRASESIHWTPRGLGSSLIRQEGSIVYSGVDPSKAATALACGIQSVLQTSQILSWCLPAETSGLVEELRLDYLHMMTRGQSGDGVDDARTPRVLRRARLPTSRHGIESLIYIAVKGSIPKPAQPSTRPLSPVCWAFPGRERPSRRSEVFSRGLRRGNGCHEGPLCNESHHRPR